MKKISSCNRLLSIALCLCMVFALLPLSASAAIPTDSNGTYQIATAAQLTEFAQLVNSGSITNQDAVLTADIVFSTSTQWTPIGSLSKKYSGSFNGQNHTVSGLYVNSDNTSFVGLFGYTKNATIQNVGIFGCELHGGSYVGGVAGYINNTTLTNCYYIGDVSGADCVGGITGFEYLGSVDQCYHNGEVSGTVNVGGIAGQNLQGSITNCQNEGKVTGSSSTGGIAGNANSGTVSTSFNTAEISADYDVGGIVGYDDGSKTTNCYNTGKISADDHVGGIVGNSSNGIIANCHNVGQISGDYSVGSLIGAHSGTKYRNCFYLNGCAADSVGYIQCGIGRPTPGTTTGDVASYTDGKSAAQLASGEVAYLLYQGCSVNNVEYPAKVWGQDVDNGKTVQAYPTLTGARIYRHTNCVGETVYTNNYDYSAHTYVNGVCTLCGETQYVEPTLDASLKFNMNISAGAEMVVNYNFMAGVVSKYADFYLEVSKDVVNGEPLVTTYGISEGHVSMETMNNPATGAVLIYNAAYRGINAKEMGDNFATTLYAIDANGKVYKGETVVSSIKDFLMGKLNDPNSIPEMKTMAVDMLKYGVAAQNNFNYDVNRPVTADLTAEQLALGTQEIPDAVDYAFVSGSGANVSTSITVGSKVELTLSCMAAGQTSPDAVKCVIADLEGNVLAQLATENKANVMFIATYDNVGARQMREIITATFYNAEGNAISKTIRWSIESYVAQTRASSASTVLEIAMVDAMLTYGDSVAAYLSASGL